MSAHPELEDTVFSEMKRWWARTDQARSQMQHTFCSFLCKTGDSTHCLVGICLVAIMTINLTDQIFSLTHKRHHMVTDPNIPAGHARVLRCVRPRLLLPQLVAAAPRQWPRQRVTRHASCPACRVPANCSTYVRGKFGCLPLRFMKAPVRRVTSYKLWKTMAKAA